MMAIQTHPGILQNEGAVDRVVRNVIGWSLMGIAAFDLAQGASVTWHGYVILLAIYPLLTSILGWDPLYQMLRTRTCETSGENHNRCGSFPYEVSSLVGKNHPCESDLNCTVNDHDEAQMQSEVQMRY